MYTWPLPSGPARQLGTTGAAINLRAERDEIYVQLDTGVFAVSGTTGVARKVTGATAVVPDTPAPAPTLATDAPQPSFWQTPTGEAVVVAGFGPPSLPQTGGCGVDRFYWVYGTLIADQGVFRWPKELSLIDFAPPR
ncbi:MAG: hypothetical protein JNK82_39650 [Myxococcaceae bacterium]|nr:hypothetical protein [Myxococcaceae bacterium]